MGIDHIITLLVALVTGSLTYLGVRVTSRGQRDTADLGNRAEEWQKLFDQYKEVMDERLQVFQDSMRAEIAGLTSRLSDSLGLNKQLLLRDPKALCEVEIPESLRVDLADVT